MATKIKDSPLDAARDIVAHCSHDWTLDRFDHRLALLLLGPDHERLRHDPQTGMLAEQLAELRSSFDSTWTAYARSSELPLPPFGYTCPPLAGACPFHLLQSCMLGSGTRWRESSRMTWLFAIIVGLPPLSLHMSAELHHFTPGVVERLIMLHASWRSVHQLHHARTRG